MPLIRMGGGGEQFNEAEIIYGTLLAGETVVVLEDPHITTTSILDIYIEEEFYNFAPETVSTEEGKAILTYPETKEQDIIVAIKLLGTKEYETQTSKLLDKINSNFVVNEFVFTTDMWAEDSAHTYEDYPYVATYATNKYSNDYVPLNITPLPMNGAVYTEEEFSAFAATNLSCADLGTHGFRVWIKEVPEVSIKFRIMGEG